ncbi:type I restriction-modification system endonuclease [Halomicronema sp. CCY15110]|uniref:type I restriction-modification system endonuclease n=1 Tax=Halomicronema sp. CCY15110 TaxID=2767773 RepID=UPI0019518D67|nr:type I restriction-modification system endonuclease [Halomicronema sp. CCY15110]
MSGPSLSPNFIFLKRHEPQLVKLGTLAERYFKDDPCTCIIKLRQFTELLAQLTAAKSGLYQDDRESQLDLLRRLRDRGIVRGEVYDVFDEIRREGNRATHDMVGTHRTALDMLKMARTLGIWFHRAVTDRNFRPGPFIPPPDPEQESETLRQEMERLRTEMQRYQAEVTQSQTAVEAAQAAAVEEAELRQIAETLLEEQETQFAAVQAHLEALQAAAAQQPTQVLQATVAQAQEAEQQLDLDETETRRLIDAQLRAAGWEVDSQELTYANGVRPQRHRHLAIAEWPTADGRADYALFVGLQAVAVVEAKRQRKDVYGAIDQAKRYSRGYVVKGDETLPGGPWGEYQVPFVFATNGRPYLKQLETKSGIWFCDLRRPENLRRAIGSWYSPSGLVDSLANDLEEASDRLEAESFNYDFELRDYQIRAIQAVESALAEDQREILLAMATGTGKTKTCIALVYRLLKTKRFRRILFLVDRSALGEQAANAFKDTRMESLQTFADIFDIKELKDTAPDRDTKVHIGTVQSFVKRLLYPSDDSATITTDQYDCIVVDECHRGYLLDRELSDSELTFRDFSDYVSKYRQVLEYFDAVKVGLTATPALHTTEIFGDPVFTYSYREAVIDGWLIDHEPPHRIITALSEDGITWQPGEAVSYYDPKTGQIDLVHAPDEIQIEVEQFNRQVITEEFNRVVCEELANHIDPSLPGKTLIFCVNNDHAMMVTNLLKQAFQDQYEDIDDDSVAIITGAADKPLEQIRRYKNEVNPKVAVTVDLLTTGIDVPPICNLVFIRRVKSRILYSQMLGRATRRCDDIGKEVFQIFDAVNLYETLAAVSDMKPVVANPQISFTQLIDELETVTDPQAVTEILDQITAKLQRKRRHLSDTSRDTLKGLAGMPVDEVVQHLRQSTPDEAATWLKQRKEIAEILDRREGGSQPVLVSYHADELRRVERGYGVSEAGEPYGRPEDYLDSFKRFIETNLNQMPALLVVTQRPRELTRAQLKALRAALDAAGYSEAMLRSAWRDATNQDVAASIIGYIRQAALGDALVPYEERVDRALKQILASQRWTAPQRKWLERIGQQLKQETVVDKAALDQGQFKTQGGFKRINKVFGGQLGQVLTNLNEQIWQTIS